eukprot:7364582-Pyramimonas_sp.AAC.1
MAAPPAGAFIPRDTRGDSAARKNPPLACSLPATTSVTAGRGLDLPRVANLTVGLTMRAPQPSHGDVGGHPDGHVAV